MIVWGNPERRCEGGLDAGSTPAFSTDLVLTTGKTWFRQDKLAKFTIR